VHAGGRLQANKKGGHCCPPSNSKLCKISVEAIADVGDGLVDDLTALGVHFIAQHGAGCFDGEVGGAGTHFSDGLSFGLGDLVFHRLGAAGDEVCQGSLCFGGEADSLFLGSSDDVFGFSLGSNALLLIFGEQGGGFLTQALGLGDVSLDLGDLLVEHGADDTRYADVDQETDEENQAEKGVEAVIEKIHRDYSLALATAARTLSALTSPTSWL